MLIALLKLIGYQYDLWERGVDTYLFYFKLGGSRMSPNAAFSFLLIGLALVLLECGSGAGLICRRSACSRRRPPGYCR